MLLSALRCQSALAEEKQQKTTRAIPLSDGLAPIVVVTAIRAARAAGNP